jgi:hypothetical protein
MSSCRELLSLLTIWSSALLVFAGCGVQTQQCDAVMGQYQPLYTLLQGDCGPITMPNYVPVDSGYRGAPIVKTENFLNGSVSTEIVMKGCSMRVTQSVMQGGAVRSKLNGDEINIENENELTGTVTLTRFNEGGTTACTGVYDARLTKNMSTISAGTM